MYSTAHLKLRDDVSDDTKPKDGAWGITPRGVLLKPRIIITLVYWTFIPPMALIVFLTTMIEHLMMRLRASPPGRAVQRLGKQTTVALARLMLKDERNADILYVLIGVSLIVIPSFLYCLHYELTNTGSFNWWLVLLYHCIRNGPMFCFFAYVATLTHMEAHDGRGFFKPQFRFLNRYMEWVLSLFYGHVPASYRIGHNKIHHLQPVNGIHDVVCTQGARRDSIWTFVDYFPKFVLLWSGIGPAWLFGRPGSSPQTHHLAVTQIWGMVYYATVVTVFFKIHFWFAFGYVLFPFFEATNYLAGINFIWHAFADPAKPGNEYIESVTIINGFYNVFNSDYHVVHHTNPIMQFGDIPAYYERDRQGYIDNEATIFQGTHEYELLFWMMLKRYDLMVRHFVDLSGKKTNEEILAMLEHRLQSTQPEANVLFPWAPPAILGVYRKKKDGIVDEHTELNQLLD